MAEVGSAGVVGTAGVVGVEAMGERGSVGFREGL